MTAPDAFPGFLWAWIGLAPVIAVVLMKVTAPYGRHGGAKAGPTVPAPVGWFLMELPALAVYPLVVLLGAGPRSAVGAALLAMWLLHYGNRDLVHPWRIRAGSPLPVVILASGMFFNVLNGLVLGLGLSTWGAPGVGEVADPRFWAGLVVFLGGFALNVHSDAVLRRLRAGGNGGYRIPRDGAFRWVSSPNYLGEMVEWAGFALASWSLAGAAFAIWTAANLLPRALAHHAWYRRTFPDYPPERRAVVPFVW